MAQKRGKRKRKKKDKEKRRKEKTASLRWDGNFCRNYSLLS